MGFWAIAAPIIASIAGGALSKSADRKARIAQEQQNELYATTSISKRVEDAKAAGLHPLYALGAQPYSPPALPVGTGGGYGMDLSGVGQALDQAFAKKRGRTEVYPESKVMLPVPAVTDLGPDFMENENSNGERYHQAGIQMVPPAEAQEYYQADAIRQQIEESKKRVEEMTMRINKERAAVVGGPPEAIEMQPDQVVRSRQGKSYLTAGTHPGWREWNMGKFSMQLPWSNEGVSESVEGLNREERALVIAHNVAEYGEAWLPWAKQWVPRLFVDHGVPNF